MHKFKINAEQWSSLPGADQQKVVTALITSGTIKEANQITADAKKEPLDQEAAEAILQSTKTEPMDISDEFCKGKCHVAFVAGMAACANLSGPAFAACSVIVAEAYEACKNDC